MTNRNQVRSTGANPGGRRLQIAAQIVHFKILDLGGKPLIGSISEVNEEVLQSLRRAHHLQQYQIIIIPNLVNLMEAVVMVTIITLWAEPTPFSKVQVATDYTLPE